MKHIPVAIVIVAAAAAAAAIINKGIRVLVYVAIPGDRKVFKKEALNILKKKDLKIEIQRIYSVKANVMPIITGATGTISKSLGQDLSNIPGEHEIKELKKTAISGTAQILWKVLM